MARRGLNFRIHSVLLLYIMDSENFAYHQERTALIISSLPSYIRAIRQNEADEFLKSLMADFIARFPMDLTGVPQSGPLRLTEVTFKTQHPDEMVEIAMKDHLNVSPVHSPRTISDLLIV